jgi:hypothetical protein
VGAERRDSELSAKRGTAIEATRIAKRVAAFMRILLRTLLGWSWCPRYAENLSATVARIVDLPATMVWIAAPVV